MRVELTAAAASLEVGGQSLSGFTLNGTTPGPTITAVEGQLVEVHLVNESVTEGVSLHWHGVDVPNAMDGVAGVTQDAVPVGGEFTYRFVAERAGSFWYHSHQVADPQVRGGLFGGLVILPRSQRSGPHDVLALAHTYGAVRTINGRDGALTVPASPGDTVRIRVVNTDNAPMPLWSDAPYRVVGGRRHGRARARDGERPGSAADRGRSLRRRDHGARRRVGPAAAEPGHGGGRRRRRLRRGARAADREPRPPDVRDPGAAWTSIRRRRPDTSTTGSAADPAS